MSKTIVDNLKIVSEPSLVTGNTKVLVRNSTTGDIEEQSVTDSDNQNLQAVTDIGDSTTNSIYSTNSINAIDASNSNKLSLKSDGLYFVDEAAVTTTKLIQTSVLPLVTVEMPAIDGRLLTNSGTETGKPITGDLQFDGNKNLYSLDSTNGGYLGLSPDYTLIQSGSLDGDNFARINLTPDGYINITTTDSAGLPTKGLSSTVDYTPNITDLDYPQEIYVIPRTGTKVGKPITGAIEVVDGVKFWINAPDAPDDKNSLIFGEGGVALDYTNIATGYVTSFICGNGGLTVYDTNPSAKGLSSTVDYTPNITDLDYPQEIYVIPRTGTKVGKPITGDLEMYSGSIIKKGTYYSGISFADDSAELSSFDNIGDSYSALTPFGDGRIVVTSIGIDGNPAKGITGASDFTTNITDLDYVQKIYIDGSTQRTTATSGSFTPTATPSNLIVIHEAGTTTSLTINMPTVPRDKQQVTIMSVGGITALTLSTAVGSILNNITTLVAGGSAKFIWIASQSKWYKI